jgi:diguanylate cyclase (GGDEF)-like protein
MTKIGKEYIDDLTELYNRRYLYIKAPRKIEEAQRRNIPLSIALIDLDYFKNINDTYGHTRGDVVLREFALFLKTLLRVGDMVFRYGGDEFVCILSKANYGQAIRISRRFVERCRIKEFTQLRLTMSIGIASYPENARDWTGLFEIADRNLYSAKRHGRDRVGVFEKEKMGLNIPTQEMIGRDEELIRIKGFIQSIFDGCGGAITISGEIGVGKTRLLHEVIKDSDYQNMRFLNSNLSATTKSIPYYPFREIIRAVIKKQGEESLFEIPQAYQIELVKIVPELSGKSKIDEQIFMVDKFRLFEGVRRFLALQASKAPLFVCLDNIHWADDSSLELFHYLVRALKESSVFFFLVYRVEEVKDSSFQNVLQLMAREGLYKKTDIEPLKTADVARMLSLMIDGIPSSELTEYIFKETGGNPFFIEELMKSLDTNGALVWHKDKWVFDRGKKVVIPYSIEGVVDRKLGMMDKEACDLLEYAAVLGRKFDFRFLHDITRMNEGHLFDLMDEILGMRLLEEQRREYYCFSEEIIREVIYNKISGLKLKRYHQVVGEKLLALYKGRTEVVVEELANHFYISRDLEKAIAYSVVAGGRAKDVYANRDAIRFYNIAIECLPQSEIMDKEVKEIEYLKKKAAVFDLVGESEKAVEDLGEAIKKATVLGERKWEADCLIALCKVYFGISRYNNTIEMAEIALEIYKELNDKKGEAEGLNCIGIAHWYLGEFKNALKLYQSSLKIAKKIGNRNLEAMTLGNCSIIFWNLGEYSKSLKYYSRSLEITKELGDPETEGRAFNNIGLIYGTLGENSKALEYYKHSLKITKEIGERKIEASTLNNIGIIYVTFGEYTKALEYYMDSLKITREVGDRKVEAMTLNNIGILYCNIGEYSKALEYCTNSLETSREIRDRQTETESLIGIGDLYLEMEDLSNAQEYYNKAFSITQMIKSKSLLAEVLLSFTSLYFEKNGLVKAKKQLKQVLSLADELGLKNIKAKALCFSGRLCIKEKKWNKAKSSFEESIRIFKKLKSKFSLARVYYYQGLMFKKSGKKTEAKKYFTKAMRIFKKLGAKVWIEKVTRELGTRRQGDTEGKFQEPNSKNQETRRHGDKVTRRKRKF